MAQATHHTPGEPPEIRDEAADTPMWLPALGLALLLLTAIFLVWRSASSEEEAAGPEETVQAEAEGEEAEADAEGAEAEQAPAAVDPHGH